MSTAESGNRQEEMIKSKIEYTYKLIEKLKTNKVDNKLIEKQESNIKLYKDQLEKLKKVGS